jgi:hypothetical protein
MTLEDYKALHRDKVRNWTVKNLKADTDFMKDCVDNPDLRDWVLGQRADMAKQKPYKIKFKGLAKDLPPDPAKPAHAPPDETESVPKIIQYYRDLTKQLL